MRCEISHEYGFVPILNKVQIVTAQRCRAQTRGAFFVALLRLHLRPQKTRCSPRPFSFSPTFHTTIGHASRSLCNATPYAFIRAYPHDKHRTVIDICPYRSKGSGIIRPSNNVVGGGIGTIETMSPLPITIATIAFLYLRHARRAPSIVLTKVDRRIFIAVVYE